jgi:hypothetical protein
MQAFRDALQDCSLEDLGYSGDCYTWRRGRIRQRLDRAVANGAWITMHPGAILQNLEFIKSDHRPILLDTDYKEFYPPVNPGPKRFEAKWIQETDFRHEVVRAWEAASTTDEGGVLGRLGRMHEALHIWDSQILRKPKRRLRKAQRDLEKAMSGPINAENEEKAKEMSNLIEILLEQDEIFWAQRSRVNWLQLGDRIHLFSITLHQLGGKRILLLN